MLSLTRNIFCRANGTTFWILTYKYSVYTALYPCCTSQETLIKPWKHLYMTNMLEKQITIHATSYQFRKWLYQSDVLGNERRSRFIFFHIPRMSYFTCGSCKLLQKFQKCTISHTEHFFCWNCCIYARSWKVAECGRFEITIQAEVAA